MRGDIVRVRGGHRETRVTRIGSALMVAGGAVIVAALVYVLGHPVDRPIFTVGVPGVVAGLIMFAVGCRIARAR